MKQKPAALPATADDGVSGIVMTLIDLANTHPVSCRLTPRACFAVAWRPQPLSCC